MIPLLKQFASSGFLILTIALSNAGEMRVWESLKGTKMTAEVISIGDSSVELLTSKGKKVTVPFNLLIRDDIEYIAGLSNNKEKTTAETKDKAIEKEEEKDTPAEKTDKNAQIKTTSLPVLTEGPGSGSHAYYEGEKYFAKVIKNGKLIITIKDDQGEEVKGWKITGASHSFTEHRRHTKQPDEEFIKFEEPQAKASTVKFQVLRKTGIKAEMIYEFTPDGFTTWFDIEEGKESPAEGAHHLVYHVQSFQAFSNDYEVFEKVIMSRKMVEGGKNDINFNNSIEPSGSAEKYEFTGPIFGKLKMLIEKGRSDEFRLSATTIDSSPMKDGLAIFGSKKDYSKNVHSKEKVTFTFK